MAHFYQVCHSNGTRANWQKLIDDCLQILKLLGIKKISFSTKRNSEAFEKLFKLKDYEKYSFYEKEVN